MRTPTEPGSQDRAGSVPLPAPIRGWNARDSLMSMLPGDAIALDNWFPGTSAVSVRPGYSVNATLPAGKSIESLMGLALPSGGFARFAGADDGIYDITAGGAIAAPASAATTGRWESAQINVGGTAFLWCCAGDGVNKSRIYDSSGPTWTELDSVSTPVLTGPTSEEITNVGLWKYRLILTQRNSLSFWYGPLNSVGGVFSNFDLGQVFHKGGYLVATANWTVDGGDGPDDRFVAITSEGEVAIYVGTDPSAADTFGIVGVYAIGKPIGKRCFLQLGGDLCVLTDSGLWPLSKSLQSNQFSMTASLTDRIQGAFNAYAKTFQTQFGWSLALLPKGPAVLVNVPFSATGSYQFVMNSITGAWCRFTNWDAKALLVVDGKLYFAVNNIVKEGWTGQIDGTSAIPCYSVGAFAQIPPRGRGKKINLVKPLMSSSSSVMVSMALDTDYQTRFGLQAFVSGPNSSSLFDSAIWDSALWGGSEAQPNSWKQVPCKTGKAFSLRVKVLVKNLTLDWSGTDYVLEAGSVLG